MLNIFKKKEKPRVLIIKDNISFSALDKGLQVSTYPKEVLEIHNQFETAADRLLIEANSIINEAATKNVDKIERLEKLGFKQASQVTELKPLLQKATLSKELLELLSYYSVNYPNNKFITEEQVKTICHKYNLVCGDVTRFKGFVPNDKLEQIESFKLKPSEQGIYIGDNFLPNAEVRKHKNYYHVYIKNDPTSKEFNKYAFQSDDGISFYADDNGIFGGIKLNSKGIYKANNLQICAPIKDMDISGLELKEGYKLERKIEIPDPVVLQPVKGGYLILAAWGDEASDELVVNQKFN
jgi:hypothetical protein